MSRENIIMAVINSLKMNYPTEYNGVYENDEEAIKEIPSSFSSDIRFREELEKLIPKQLYNNLYKVVIGG